MMRGTDVIETDDFPAAVEPAAEPERDDRAEAIAWLMRAPEEVNLLGVLAEDDVTALGSRVKVEVEIDKTSREAWFKRLDEGIKRADLSKEGRKAPWPGASDVKYPLIMTAALKFNAQAYPALVPPTEIVKCAVHGADNTGQKAARAARVSAHMSHQLRNSIRGWEEATDKLLLQVAIAGTMHRKTWLDPGSGEIRSRLLRPGALIVNDDVASLAQAPRLSEEFELYPDEVQTRIRSGFFRGGEWTESDDADADDTLAPLKFIEQHRRHDLDGDGYPEPYIVTVHAASDTVVRVVANWQPDDVVVNAQSGEVVSIPPEVYYTDYHFLPSVTGGYHSIGLGVLLGDMSKSIDAAINRLNDAATMQTLGSGWIGKEARLSSFMAPHRPGEYKRVSVSGGDLRNGIVERDVQPSPVMFQLLGLLIEAARELANIQDIQSQAQKSNQPATTTVALIEQGMAVYTAVFKRIHLSLKAEFAQIAKINARYLPPEVYAAFHDVQAEAQPPAMPGMPPQAMQQAVSPQADYDLRDMDIEPVADPRAVTSPQRMAQAQLLMDLSETGAVDRGEATKRLVEAAGIPDADKLAPQPDPMAEHMAKLNAAMAEANLQAMQADVLKTGMEAGKIEAEIRKVMAEAGKTGAEAHSEAALLPLEAALKAAQALQARVKAMMDANNGPAADARRSGSVAGEPGYGARLGGPYPGR